MTTELQVALLRGINVGSAKRVAMADLRKMMGDLGYGDVRTVLNSGNVVFRTRAGSAGIAPLIEETLVLKLGVAARATVLTAAQFGQIMEQNSLLARVGAGADPARLLVAVPADPADLARLRPLLVQDWGQEGLATGQQAAYLWCPGGVLASRAAAALGALLGDAVTSRNWSTMHKLWALLQEGKA